MAAYELWSRHAKQRGVRFVPESSSADSVQDSEPGLTAGLRSSRICGNVSNKERKRLGLPVPGARACPRPGSRRLLTSAARMAERSQHRAREARDGRSERPATGHGRARAGRRVTREPAG